MTSKIMPATAPAIATAIAMIAGLCVLQAFKVLRAQLSKAKFFFLTHLSMSELSELSELARSVRLDWLSFVTQQPAESTDRRSSQ
jgi:hypothetical protein